MTSPDPSSRSVGADVVTGVDIKKEALRESGCGGTIGIQVLGTVFANNVTSLTTTRLAKLGITMGSAGTPGGSMSLDLTQLPAPVAEAVRSSYGDSIGLLFLIAALISVLSIIAVVFMRATRLRSTFDVGPSGTATE
jgi:hypothetical protein